MLHGSCLCGGIKYQINGQLSGPLNCHCFDVPEGAGERLSQPGSSEIR